jgi:non-specific serine/threonine protein kinase/serine/threonine-protein kinase
MTPERWQQAKELFQSALEREPGQREAFLEEVCGGDPGLRAEIESLLAAYQEAGSFIEPPTLKATPATLLETPAETVIGQRIGPYQIIREIGQGGMGSVYLAVRADEQYSKRVAIKLVRRGMDSQDIVRRFQHERQILAALDHPNIGRLLDGGTTSEGLPYFAMEYIEGQPITSYCDTHKLTTVERLKLFRSVCAAVQYAHQNLVVHRDIKPGNILVTAEGTVKLLDFGIAKLLNPELVGYGMPQTATVMRVMTPDYASPEQVRGEGITTASDVYSLGVVLYELLTGHRPFRLTGRSPQEVERVISEQEPDKPSDSIAECGMPNADSKSRWPLISRFKTRMWFVARHPPSAIRHPQSLRGDLDNIVLLAMRKEPQRRYASAEQLSEDIRRHLEGRPVIARKDTLGYRAGKFIQRHKTGVAAAALILMTLLGGIVATAWQARVAGIERARAERRFNDLRKLANSFIFDVHDDIATLPGSTRARERLVKTALEYLDSLAQEAINDSELQRELALAYQKVGDVQGNPTNANLGDTAGALASYHRALAIAEALVTAHPTEAQARQSLALIYQKLGDLQGWTGDLTAAVESARKSLALFKSLAAADVTDLKARQSLAISYIKFGDILGNPRFPNVGDRAEALRQYRLSLALWQALHASDPTNATTRRYLGLIHERIGIMLQEEGELAESLQSFHQSLVIRESFAADYSTNTDARRDLAVGYEKIADILVLGEDFRGALEHARKSLAIFEALSAADRNNVNASRSLSISYEKMGDLFLKMGQATEALNIYQKSLAIREALSAADSSNVQLRRDLAKSYSRLGAVNAEFASKTAAPVSQQIERWRQARSWYQRSREIYLSLRSGRLLTEADKNAPDELARKIAQVEATLQNLRSPTVK